VKQTVEAKESFADLVLDSYMVIFEFILTTRASYIFWGSSENWLKVKLNNHKQIKLALIGQTHFTIQLESPFI
jgi:hypothetical protein